MNSTLLHETDGLRTYALVFDRGDEVLGELQAFAGRAGLAGSRFTAIGAFRRAILGYFDWEQKDSLRSPIEEQVEVLALAGDVTRLDAQPRIHAHVVLGRRDGTAVGGHLLEAEVRPTLELVLVESPRHLQRRFDPDTNLALIALG
jgi:predicted DNA-binding protein with PD1-like motif